MATHSRGKFYGQKILVGDSLLGHKSQARLSDPNQEVKEGFLKILP